MRQKGRVGVVGALSKPRERNGGDQEEKGECTCVPWSPDLGPSCSMFLR